MEKKIFSISDETQMLIQLLDELKDFRVEVDTTLAESGFSTEEKGDALNTFHAFKGAEKCLCNLIGQAISRDLDNGNVEIED